MQGGKKEEEKYRETVRRGETRRPSRRGGRGTKPMEKTEGHVYQRERERDVERRLSEIPRSTDSEAGLRRDAPPRVFHQQTCRFKG